MLCFIPYCTMQKMPLKIVIVLKFCEQSGAVKVFPSFLLQEAHGSTMPAYFRFLTILAFHVFLQEKVCYF